METFEYSPPPLHHPNQFTCFHSVIFFIICLLGAGGVCGLLLNGIYFWLEGGGGGGGHVWSTLRLRLRLGIVSGVGYTQI